MASFFRWERDNMMLRWSPVIYRDEIIKKMGKAVSDVALETPAQKIPDDLSLEACIKQWPAPPTTETV